MYNHIVLIDTDFGGHKLSLTSSLIEFFSNRNLNVTLICPTEHVNCIAQDVRNKVNYCPLTTKFAENTANQKKECSALSNWQSARRSFDSTGLNRGETFVFIPWLDNFISSNVNKQFLSQIVNFDWGGIYYHPPNRWYSKSKSLFLKSFLNDPFRLFSGGNCKLIGLLDESLVNKYQRKSLASKIQRFPDFSVTTTPVSNELCSSVAARAKGRPIFTNIGVMQRRKNIIPMIRAAIESDTNWYYLIAGPIHWSDFSPEEQSLIKLATTQPENLTLLDQQLSEAEINSLLSCSDLVNLAYTSFIGSSQILTKCAGLKTLVVGAPGFLIAERVTNYKLGWISDLATKDIVCSLLANLNSHVLTNARGKAQFDRYSSFQSISHLSDFFSVLLKSTAN